VDGVWRLAEFLAGNLPNRTELLVRCCWDCAFVSVSLLVFLSVYTSHWIMVVNIGRFSVKPWINDTILVTVPCLTDLHVCKYSQRSFIQAEWIVDRSCSKMKYYAD
jgi:hypothetical protein